jgi:antitoxin component of MazEF toxin-antitoxin module
VARDILKVRKVGGTLVVTLTQSVLESVRLNEGDRVLIEALPPRRILISKEVPNMQSTRRLELELAILEAKLESFNSQVSADVAEYNAGSSVDSSDLDRRVKYLNAERDKVAVSIAQKKLELFDLQGEQLPVIRRWNLNENEGRYAATNVVESVIELELGLKRINGDRQPVGTFHLDLDSLADGGFVTRRIVGGNRVFDVQIYRDSNGEYSLGVRQDQTTRLADYAVALETAH